MSETPLDPTNDETGQDTSATQPEGESQFQGEDHAPPADSETVGTDSTTVPEAPSLNDGKDTSLPQPETVAAENVSDPTSGVVTSVESTRTQDPGVQTGGLRYVVEKDLESGVETRRYLDQDKDVDVVVEDGA